jgi:hypothetical protein
MSTFTRKIQSSGSVKVLSEGVLDLEGSGSYVKANELQLTTKLAVAQGGHGASTAEGARANLGLAIGSDVQAYSAKLADIASLEPSSNQYIKWDGSNFIAYSLPAGTNYNGDEVTITESDNTFSIKDGGVGSTQLADSAVSSAKLADSSVSSAKIADSAVNANKLASNAVTTAKIQNGAVTFGKIESTLANSLVRSNGAYLQSNDGESTQVQQQVFEMQNSSDGQFTLASLSVATDSSLVVDVLLSCSSSDMSEYASFKLHCMATNNAGTSALAEAHDEIIHRSHHSISAVMDLNGNNVRVRCTPKSSTNMRWSARIVSLHNPKYSA